MQSQEFDPELSRERWLQECGEAVSGATVEVSLPSFLDNYAPFPPTEHDVQVCIDMLLACGRLVYSVDGCLVFAACAGKPSAHLTPEAAYDFLEDICQVIGATRIKGRRVLCGTKKCIQYPAESVKACPILEGGLRLLQPLVDDEVQSGLPSAEEVAVHCNLTLSRARRCSPTPYKLQIVVEDAHMALWYWSRSHAAKSAAFTSTTDIPATVRALATFLFARREELGFDPSVRRLPDDTLIYQMHDRLFRTVR